ncbi:MAG: glycosyltransferase family 39 protein [Candidatus Nanohaloarchaea archaeon]|nr:glycosyltransferase family 39 protein [Candidatus Nanohaloarchaea archaeon]
MSEEKPETDKEGEKGNGSEKYQIELETPDWLIDFFKDPYNLGFLAILAVALYFRLINLGVDSMWPDTANHLYMVRHYLHAHTLTEVAYQGFILFLTIIKLFSFFFPLFLAGKLASMLYSLVGITSMYFLGRELANRETGIAAALVMAFVPIFWFQSTRPLLDANITSAVALLMLCLVKYERTRKRSWAIGLGLSMIAVITTKLVGMLAFFAVGLYYLLAYRTELLELLKRKDFQILAAIVIGGGLLFMLFNYSITGTLSARQPTDVTKPGGSSSGGLSLPFHFFFFKQIPSMISLVGVLLLIPGLYVSIRRYMDGEKYWLGLYLIALAWFGFFSTFGNKSPRYILPAIPTLILVAMVGVPAIFGKVRWEVLVAGLAITAMIYPAGAQIIESKAHSYTGYGEAGRFLKKNMGENDIVIAGAKRQIRFFSGRNYKGDGGIEGNLVNPSTNWNRSYFLKKVQSYDRPVWVVVDSWEYTQPDFMHPLNQKKLSWFQNAGFRPVKIVRRKVPTKNGLQKYPAVFVFRYSGKKKS